MTLTVPVLMIPSHQQTWQDFFGVSRSNFSQAPHWLQGHGGREKEYVFALESETIFISVFSAL